MDPATMDSGAITSRIISPSLNDTQIASTSGSTVFAVFNILFGILTFSSITLPTWLFTFFSTSLTVTMNATTLVLIALAFASTISYFVRYRYLNMYARLPPEPQRKEAQIDLFPEVSETDSKRGLSNYLDEFLSAIKVFGYLERPVFHELTRTMQTRKLIAGETLLLEEEQGFCLVVDGLVQIFVKAKRDRSRETSVDEEEEDNRPGEMRQGYQLLTEVKNGAPMSSLFSILSLFTEDVKLRYDDKDNPNGSEPTSTTLGGARRAANSYTNLKAAGSNTESPVVVQPTSPPAQLPTTSSSMTHLPVPGSPLPTVPPLSLDTDGTADAEDRPELGEDRVHARKRSRIFESAHPDIVARATVDTTIAIIPATAFRRLTRVYPRASAHIVQVILTRLQRVTLTTGHAYLGLTSEVLRTEKLINQYTTYDLPGFLRGSALDRLKEKFAQERERTGPEDSSKGIALHNPRATARRQSNDGLRKDAMLHAKLAAALQTKSEDIAAHGSPGQERNGVSAGDLLTNAHIPRRSDHRNTQSLQKFTSRANDDDASQQGTGAPSPPSRFGLLRRQESLDEDSFFRESILECTLKAIGLTNAKNAIRKTESVEQSPRLVSYDSKRYKAVFNNAFGFMDALETSTEGDGDSVASMAVSNASSTGGPTIQEELSNDVEIVFFPKGSVLVEQGERNPGLYYVIDGFLDVSVPDEDSTAKSNLWEASSDHLSDLVSSAMNGESPLNQKSPTARARPKMNRARERSTRKLPTRKSLYLTKPGGLAGYLGTISSRKSFVDVTAKTDVYVGFLPRASIERIVEKYPIVLLTMAKRLTSLLPRVILHIDFALEWVQVDAGQAIYHQGDESDAIYIVLNGRLRSWRKGPDGKMQVVGEFGQGESVGELEVLTESMRGSTLHAIRDTEIAKLPKTLFNSLALENPEITIKISKLIATRMRDLTEKPILESGPAATKLNAIASSTSNIRTVAILPVTAGVPVVDFSSRLMSAFSQIGTSNGVTSLNQAAILNHLGRHAFSRMGKLKLSQHLADLEEKYGLVLYVADTNVNSPWTQACVSQADCILLVGLTDGSPNIGEFERFLLTTKTTARKELVLLHAERYCPPGLTRKWLRNRVWINGSHHHVHMPFKATPEPVHPQTRRFGSAIKQRVQVLQAEIQKYTSRRVRQTPLYSADTPFKGDFHRLARRLTGKSVGLVLGGGGARGIAHIGIIRALEEAGIPIDIVGGTSIGAFVGALYAWDADMVPMYGRAKKFAGRMGSMWRFALDLTYPSASYTTGHEFNRGIFKTFGTAQMEDFWLEFYCNTTNISKSRAEFHTSGYVWRYVRASMSLTGMLPPLCDDGSMLVDGGYIDNLTVEHMKSLGADVIFAVDVGSIDEQTPQAYGDSLSGFWATFNRWNPFSTYANPPTLSDIQARLAYVSSVDALERAKLMHGCHYMRPPVTEYGTLEFAKFEEIYRVGYEYGKETLAKLRGQGVLPVPEETEEKRQLRWTMRPRRASI